MARNLKLQKQLDTIRLVGEERFLLLAALEEYRASTARAVKLVGEGRKDADAARRELRTLENVIEARLRGLPEHAPSTPEGV